MEKLSESQKLDLERKLRRSRKIDDRNRLCVILGYDEGSSIDELASVLRISHATVYNYLNDFHKNQKVENLPRGGGKPKLDDGQSQVLKKHLSEVTYLKVKEICAYVKTTFRVSISRSGMTLWLHENRFVFKCPKKIPGKLNPEKQKEFVEEYEALKNRLLPGEEIYFVDAVHPEHQSQASRGWIQKGKKMVSCMSNLKTLLKNFPKNSTVGFHSKQQTTGRKLFT